MTSMEVALQRLDKLLDEGLNSGSPIDFTPEWWRSRKQQRLAMLPPADDRERSTDSSNGR